MKPKARFGLFVLLMGLASGEIGRAQTTSLTTVPPAGMALVPAGAFMMGDNLDGEKNAQPVTVTVSAFYMDTDLVSYGQWQLVYNWAAGHGYGFVHAGAGKAANHPVQTVDWYDAVKWCNARSQQGDLMPVYYTDAALTQVFINGEVAAIYANWTNSGYRLPTEAEWEKAARGGLVGKRFPWGNTISKKQANYDGKSSIKYDLGPSGYHSSFSSGGKPYTSPVGYFAANGYGLHDMAGNVSEWCWDWYGTPYAGGNDPHGPAIAGDAAVGNCRVARGGDWNIFATLARCAYRIYYDPSFALNHVGFRCVRGL